MPRNSDRPRWILGPLATLLVLAPLLAAAPQAPDAGLRPSLLLVAGGVVLALSGLRRRRRRNRI